MTTQPNFTGYPARVWATCYQALSWLNGLLAASGAAAANTFANPANVVFETLRNGSTAIEAWQTGAALVQETQNLAAVQALPLSLDPTTAAYFNARVIAVDAAGIGISALPPSASPFGAVASLQGGSPAIADSGYLEWCMSFDGESPPAGLTAATMPSFATGAAQAWLNVANAVGVLQGASPTAAYDTAARQYRCSSVVASVIAQLQSGPFAAANWNGVVALPTILLDGSSIGTSPALLQAQQAMVVRYVLDATADSIAAFLYSLRTSIGSVPVTAILSNNDTLLDIAARETGNFENWTTVAAINNLKPPYPGPTNQAIALSGKPLYMPGSNILVGADGTPPSYPNDAMGTDYYFGPINGVQPAWNGDIPLITGLLNFAAALGRRIQTPIGSLTYHQEYGSRIPGEVGAVQSADEASRLAAFGKAALQADKRTGRILFASASVLPGSLATFTGLVLPVGPGGGTPVQVNQSINPPGGA